MTEPSGDGEQRDGAREELTSPVDVLARRWEALIRMP